MKNAGMMQEWPQFFEAAPKLTTTTGYSKSARKIHVHLQSNAANDILRLIIWMGQIIAFVEK